MELRKLTEDFHRDSERLMSRAARLTGELNELRHLRAAARGRASRAGIDPRVQAGRHYDGALDVLRSAETPLSRVWIGRLGGIPSGTLTHAMKALAADGLVEMTGERDGRSDIFRLTEKGRRGTRRPPGS